MTLMTLSELCDHVKTVKRHNGQFGIIKRLITYVIYHQIKTYKVRKMVIETMVVHQEMTTIILLKILTFFAKDNLTRVSKIERSMHF